MAHELEASFTSYKRYRSFTLLVPLKKSVRFLIRLVPSNSAYRYQNVSRWQHSYSNPLLTINPHKKISLRLIFLVTKFLHSPNDDSTLQDPKHPYPMRPWPACLHRVLVAAWQPPYFQRQPPCRVHFQAQASADSQINRHYQESHPRQLRDQASTQPHRFSHLAPYGSGRSVSWFARPRLGAS